MSTLANYSPAELLHLHPNRQEILDSFSPAEAEALLKNWRFWARPKQLLPGSADAANQRDDWTFWVVNCGRGFGKTRTGAETVREWAQDPNERILMVAPTADDVRSTMLEGPSGLLNCYPLERKPDYNPSRHLIAFPSGAVGITRSAEEPARLRGPQFTKFWADELCAWNYPQEAWDQIMFAFRLKTKNLRGIITTTPRPLPVYKTLLEDPRTVVTTGSSYENSSNLSAEFFELVIKRYEGTRLGRQEINAELLEDVQGALWTRALIDAAKIRRSEIRWEAFVRIVVAIDPAVSTTDESDETGIIVAGLVARGDVVVFGDLTCRESPGNWAKVAVAAYRNHHADRIVGEVNNGGDLVERNIQVEDSTVAFRAVRASRGKMVRAEPVAALYERGMVHHVEDLERLEDQMCSYVPGITRKSPDRMDALVWAITDLVLDQEEVTMQSQIGTWQSISPI